jgi:isopentenyldiphosphate isomerase
MKKTPMENPEILEVWDWEHGLPTGEAVPREIAHREGVPHEAVHLWIVRDLAREPGLLFQRRASHKDTYPDCLDITVGGHVPYGFTGDKLAKETREEIGIEVPKRERIDLGWFRFEEREEGLFQREFQRVYLLNDERPLDGYRFNDGEVVGVFAVRLRDLEGVMRGDGKPFAAEGYAGGSMTRTLLGRGDFHPLLFSPSMERYMEVVISAARELAGTGRVSIRMPEP